MTNAANIISAELTHIEAVGYLTEAVGRGYAVRNVQCEIDELDEIVWWTADVIDAYTGDTAGDAMFPEHYPSVMINWR